MAIDLISQGTADQQIVMRRQFGSNALDMMASLVINTVYQGLVELLSNSYDADATEVSVLWDPDENPSSLIVYDNGSGMGRQNLNGFYGLGDSHKLVERISPKGRPRIGKYGVATILLGYLAREYTLTTRKEGLETVMEEVFDGPLRLDKEISGTTTPTNPALHGTTIHLKDLKFGEGRAFNLRTLRTKIQWELPLLPDFKIFVNEQEVTPKSIDNATEFAVDHRGSDMGRVVGSLYITGRSSPMAGVHVYVNGRRYGDPSSLLDVGAVKLSLANRVVGILNADDLERAVLFDRGKFREDDPGVTQLRDFIGEKLQELRRYSDSNRGQGAITRVESRRIKILEGLRNRAVSVGLDGITRETKVGFSDDLPPSTPGRLGPLGKGLVLNARYPSLLVTTTTKLPEYECAMLSALAETCALERLKGTDSLAAFLDTRAAILSRLATASTGRQEEIYPTMAYKLTEAARLTGRSLGGIRYMVDCGILVRSDGDKVLGAQLKHVEERAIGMATLYDFLFPTYRERVRSEVKKYAAALDKLGSRTEPFFRRLHGEKGNCYFVEGTSVTELGRQFSNQSLTQRTFDPAEICSRLGDRSINIQGVVDESDGLTLDQAQHVVEFASTLGSNILAPRGEQAKPGEPIRYNYGRFVRAIHNMRAGESK